MRFFFWPVMRHAGSDIENILYIESWNVKLNFSGYGQRAFR